MERGKFREWVCYSDERKRIFDEIIAEVIRLERERCAKIVEDFYDWVWPDKNSEAYQECGDYAGPVCHESLKNLAAEIRRNPL